MPNAFYNTPEALVALASTGQAHGAFSAAASKLASITASAGGVLGRLMDGLLEPWQQDATGVAWIILMGFLVTFCCGLAGSWLVLRGKSMAADAMGHSVLPGLVLAFVLTDSRGIVPMVLGGLLFALLATLGAEALAKHSKLPTDTALGIAFSTCFALGVLLVNQFASSVDLDADCVLYGEIGFTPLAASFGFASLEIPFPILRMAAMALVLVILSFLFYKELAACSFDADFTRALRLPTDAVHYGLMAMVALVALCAFEAVGSILVLAMVVFPPSTARLLTARLSVMLLLNVPIALLAAWAGYYMAFELNTSIAAAMASAAAIIFVIVALCQLPRSLKALLGG